MPQWLTLALEAIGIALSAAKYWVAAKLQKRDAKVKTNDKTIDATSDDDVLKQLHAKYDRPE